MIQSRRCMECVDVRGRQIVTIVRLYEKCRVNKSFMGTEGRQSAEVEISNNKGAAIYAIVRLMEWRWLAPRHSPTIPDAICNSKSDLNFQFTLTYVLFRVLCPPTDTSSAADESFDASQINRTIYTPRHILFIR